MIVIHLCSVCGQKIPWKDVGSHPCYQQDCPFCPLGGQDKVAPGRFVDGKPSCEWCAMVDAAAHLVNDEWTEEDHQNFTTFSNAIEIAK